MGDLLLDDGAVEVVHPEGEAELGDLLAKHHPVRLHMVEVVEEEPRDGEDLEVVEAGGLCPLGKVAPRGLKGQRDENLKAPRLILQLPQ